MVLSAPAEVLGAAEGKYVDDLYQELEEHPQRARGQSAGHG